METLITSMIPAFEAGIEADICNKLQEFNKENAGTFSFPGLDMETKKKFIGDVLRSLEADYNTECDCLCLEALRILSREKTKLCQLAQKEGVLLLMGLAGLEETPVERSKQVVIEAEKCLCNLVFNSPEVQKICQETNCVKYVLDRVKLYSSSDANITTDIKFFDMRLVFLITALCPKTRAIVRNDCDGISLLTSVLETDVLADVLNPPAVPLGAGAPPDTLSMTAALLPPAGGEVVLTDGVVSTVVDVVVEERVRVPVTNAELACEVLKALFNTVIHTKLKDMEQEEDLNVLKRLGLVCRTMLLTETSTQSKTEEYHSQTINLLTCALPLTCIQELTPEPTVGAVGGLTPYGDLNMDAVVSILRFLELRLDRAALVKKLHVVEQLNPVLSALCVLSRTNRNIRKYLKEMVLPPLNKNQACHLPEEGDCLRNKLVRLMTNHSTDIKEVVADFLFILCKESVNRLIKYTGYGNAAGMLARRGLLAGGYGSTDYSSDEEDSDTEDYKDVRNDVNPVTGRVEVERPNPMEGMTEEQKEYAAVELANMIHRITREGVIQPMSVSNDGKLIPMMDIMQQAVMAPSSDDIDDEQEGDARDNE